MGVTDVLAVLGLIGASLLTLIGFVLVAGVGEPGYVFVATAVTLVAVTGAVSATHLVHSAARRRAADAARRPGIG